MLGWNEDIKKELKACGDNVFIGHNVMINNPAEVSLGDNVRIDPFTLITAHLDVGSNVQICAYSMLGGGPGNTITLGDWTFVGYGSKLFCGSEDYSGKHGPVNEFWGQNKIYRGDIIFKDYSGIASDVIVMPGCSLPEGCTIGAKSFVYKTFWLGEWTVYIGNPLKRHKYRDKDAALKAVKSHRFQKYPLKPKEQYE